MIHKAKRITQFVACVLSAVICAGTSASLVTAAADTKLSPSEAVETTGGIGCSAQHGISSKNDKVTYYVCKKTHLSAAGKQS